MTDFDRFENLNFTPLDDYKRHGKVLKGAFADLPGMVSRSWINQVIPEMIWVLLIRCRLDIYQFTDAFRPVAYNFARHGITDPTLTGISKLPAEKKAVAINALTSSPFLREALAHCSFLVSTCPTTGSGRPPLLSSQITKKIRRSWRTL